MSHLTMTNKLPPIEHLNELLEYKDGELFWRVNRCNNKIKAGTMAGTYNRAGYKFVRIDGVKYSNHRIIFFMHYLYVPECVDHINGNGLDNRIENLRPATRLENQRNQRLSKANTSGAKGVRRQGNKWRVDIKLETGLKYFGTYDDLELAELVAIEMRNKYFGEFARHV